MRLVGLTLVGLLALGFASGVRAQSCEVEIHVGGSAVAVTIDGLYVGITDSSGWRSVRGPTGQPLNVDQLSCGPVVFQITGTSAGSRRWWLQRTTELLPGRINRLDVDLEGIPATLRTIDALSRGPLQSRVAISRVGVGRCGFDGVSLRAGGGVLCPETRYRLEVRDVRDELSLSLNGTDVAGDSPYEGMTTFDFTTPHDRAELVLERRTDARILVELRGNESELSAEAWVWLELTSAGRRTPAANVRWNRVTTIAVEELPVTVRPVVPRNSSIVFEPEEIEVAVLDADRPVLFEARLRELPQLKGRLLGDALAPTEVSGRWSCGPDRRHLVQTESDDEGRFELSCWEGCELSLFVESFADYAAGARIADVDDCSETIEIELERVRYLRGQVFDGEGRPVAGLRLERPTAMTDRDGRFSRRDLRSDQVTIKADEGATEKDEQRILVDRSTGAEPTYALPDEGDLEVELAWLQGGRFCAQGDDETQFSRIGIWRAGWTEPLYRYTWDQGMDKRRPCTEILLPGLYRVYASFTDDYLPQWWPDTTARDDAADLQLAADATVELEFERVPAGTIKVSDWRACGLDRPSSATLCQPAEEGEDPECHRIELTVHYVNRPLEFRAPAGSWQVTLHQLETERVDATDVAIGVVEVEQGETTVLALEGCPDGL